MNGIVRRWIKLRKIKIKSWKSKAPIYQDGRIIGSEDKDETLLDALNVLLGNKRPEEMPRGLDHFRTFNRLSKAFDKAEKSKVLEVEEVDYKFLKETIEKDAPAVWGMNLSISEAIEEFLSAKQE